MKKIIKILAIIFFSAFILIQFIRPNRENPGIDELQTLESTMKVPVEVQAILNRSCVDCHSHKTVYPWYSNVAPVSWWLSDHINHGRSHLNFSIWNTYEPQSKERKLDEICEEVQAGAMPLPSYLWAHWEAKLTDADIRTLCDWTEKVNKESQNDAEKKE